MAITEEEKQAYNDLIQNLYDGVSKLVSRNDLARGHRYC